MADNAVIGALRVLLSIDTAEFRSGLNDMRAGLLSASKSMKDIGGKMTALISAPLAAFGGLAVKTAGDFEASMNRVQAASSASADELSQMQKLAMKLGADTPKSASDAADAMEMLAKNGLTARQILDGAADASIRLSIATGGDLSKSADVATNVMAQFGAKAEDLGKIVDHITGVTLQSQFGFDDYALAIGQAGGVAGALGVSIDDFNAAIAATSSVFSSGSDAGTSFKSFLTSLVPKSKQAGEVMKELGLSFFNADGSMKSMAAIAQELQDKMQGLSQMDLNDKMNSLFGVDGMRTAIALMQQGGAGVEQMNAKIQAASADEQAAARMKGFNGELEKLGGAFETLQIAIANSGLLSFVTDMVKRLGEFIDWLSQTNPEILKWGTIVGGLVVIIGPVVTAVGLLVAGIAAIGIPIAAAVAGVTALTVAVVAFWPEIQNLTARITEFLSNAWAGFVEAWNSIPEKIAAVTAAVKQFGADIVAVFTALPGQMLEIGGQIIEGLWNGIKAKWETVKANIYGLGTSIGDSIRDALGIHSPSRVMHEIGINIGQGLTNGIAASGPQAVSAAQGVASNIRGAFNGLETVGTGVGDGITGAFDSIGSSLADAIKGTKDWRDVALGAIRSVASSLLSNMGSGGGIGGGIFKGLLSGLLGFANGGSFQVGGAGGIDSQLVMFRASPSETVSVTKPGQRAAGGGSVIFAPTINAPGADKAALQQVRRDLADMKANLPKVIRGEMSTAQTRKTRPT